MALTEDTELVLRVFATLRDSAPSHADYKAHLKYIQDFGKDGYFKALDKYFANHFDVQLAAMLLQSTGLNTVDLEGDGNTDNMHIAMAFIQNHAGNRIQAMLDLTEQLSRITSGPLRNIARAYNEKIADGHTYSSRPDSSEAALYNDNIKVEGTAGSDAFYADGSAGKAQYIIGGQKISLNTVWLFNTADQNTENDSQKLGALKAGTPTTAASYGVKLQVNFRGLLSREIAIDDQTDFQASQLDINLAIKKAINEDAVLGKLLEAVDGPGGTLGVLSKFSARHDDSSLSIRLIAPDQAALSDEVVANFIAKNPNTGVSDAASMLHYIESHVSSAAAAGSLHHNYYAQSRIGLDDNTRPVYGQDSNAAHDHLIAGSAGNDVLILGTAGKNQLAKLLNSNDTVQYTGAFDHDTIVNFQAGPFPNADKFDFTLLHKTTHDIATSLHKADIGASKANRVGSVSDGQIRLVNKITNPMAHTHSNNSAEAIKQLFTDAGAGTMAKQLYIAIDAATGTGDVYQVADGNGANDLTVTLLGSITMANESITAPYHWSDLTIDNFV